MLKNLLPPTATFIELRKFVNFIQNGSTLPFSLSVPRTHRIEGTKGAGLHSPPPVPWQGRRKEFPGSKFNLQCLKKIRALSFSFRKVRPRAEKAFRDGLVSAFFFRQHLEDIQCISPEKFRWNRHSLVFRRKGWDIFKLVL